MAQLVVRNLDDDVKARLQARARRHRRSLEAEARDILRNAANAEELPSAALGAKSRRASEGAASSWAKFASCEVTRSIRRSSTNDRSRD
jgi:plasmid stability protein